MCTYRPLALSENGYISLCTKCNHIQIAFGTTIICLTEEQFVYFKMCANNQLNYYKNDDFHKHKIIQMPTFSVNTQIILSFNELKRLIALIEEADILIQIDKIINNTEKTEQYKNENS